MDQRQKTIAQQCSTGAEQGTMTFPQIVGTLMEAGFEGYLVDLRLARATYYLPDGAGIELPAPESAVPIAVHFDTSAVQVAIREAQTLAPGYTYRGFCDKAKHAGCAGYLVSLLGRRVLYFGRGAETHVEHFPQ